jgi:GGDEF domain-containing protein
MDLNTHVSTKPLVVSVLGVWAAVLMALGSLIASLALHKQLSLLMSMGVVMVTLTIAVVGLRPRGHVAGLIAATALSAGLSAAVPGAGLLFASGLAALIVVSFLLKNVLSRAEPSNGPERGTKTRELVSGERRSLDRAVSRELSRARRYERPATVATLSVAPIAKAGLLGRRRQLERVAQVLRSQLRQTDVLGFLHSDGLALFLPETTQREARAIVDRLAAGLLAGERASLSLGFATFPRDGVTWELLQEVAKKRERHLGYPARIGPRTRPSPDGHTASNLVQRKELEPARKTSG